MKTHKRNVNDFEKQAINVRKMETYRTVFESNDERIRTKMLSVIFWQLVGNVVATITRKYLGVDNRGWVSILKNFYEMK